MGVERVEGRLHAALGHLITARHGEGICDMQVQVNVTI
jgi:hypothetical protein